MRHRRALRLVHQQPACQQHASEQVPDFRRDQRALVTWMQVIRDGKPTKQA
jgi:hypothetical protein